MKIGEIMRLIIAGGRHNHLTGKDILELKKIKNVTCVISGGADGIDTDGETWAKNQNIKIRRFNADWSKHGKLAGPLRNRQMAENADALALFAGGRGTESMLKEAKKAGIKIFDFRPNAQLNLNFDGDI